MFVYFRTAVTQCTKLKSQVINQLSFAVDVIGFLLVHKAEFFILLFEDTKFGGGVSGLSVYILNLRYILEKLGQRIVGNLPVPVYEELRE